MYELLAARQVRAYTVQERSQRAPTLPFRALENRARCEQRGNAKQSCDGRDRRRRAARGDRPPPERAARVAPEARRPKREHREADLCMSDSNV